MSQTPMERQYNALKEEAGENLLFFRLGDFYEMFGDDAKMASEILEIALTTRNKKSENPTPMCGFPIHAAEKYIARITRSGKSVAIAEQVSDPSAPGIVQRKIVRIVTPGTTFSDQILEPGKSNYIAALYSLSSSEIAVAFAELSTGDAFVQSFHDIEDAIKEISVRETAEVLLTPDQFREYSPLFNYFSGAISRHFLPENTRSFLHSFFSVKTLKAFGIEENPLCISTVALLCSFLEETQKTDLAHITGVSYRTEKNYLSLDQDTIQNLELFASRDGNRKNGLLYHIDYTKTAMGSRALQELMFRPLADKESIRSRHARIEALVHDRELADTLKNSFQKISDLERIIARISTGRASPSDYIQLKNSLEVLEELLENLDKTDTEQWCEWRDLLGKQMRSE